MKQVTVIGAGFSGLTLAYELAKLGFQVKIIEKTSRTGGLIRTLCTPHGLAETAANALMLDQNVEQLLQEIGVELSKPLDSSKKRFIFRKFPRRWPLNFLECFQFAKHIFFHLLTRKRYLRPHKRETVFSWGQRNLGSAALNFLLAPGLQGIYAGDVAKLSSHLIFSPFFEKNRKKYHGMASAPKGMQEIISGLEVKLQLMGVQIEKNSAFTLSSKTIQSGPLVIATSAHSASQILSESYPELGLNLEKIELAPLISVTSFWQNSTSIYRGFGCLIPHSAGLRTLGVLINSCIFANRSHLHSETYILGGATDPEVLQLSDLEIRQLIQNERKTIFLADDVLIDCVITRWPAAIPHYTVELEKILETLLLPPNIFLHGNYLGQLGLSKILNRSKTLAREIEQKYE